KAMFVSGSLNILCNCAPIIRNKNAVKMQITAVTALLLFNMEIKVKIDENTIAVISTVTANNKTIFMSISKKPRSGIPMQRYGIKNAI
ncbi:hypothetical protein, partial [Anaerovorax odorimutans]|uniref:hypothetical protein n=1 Tax=Anaerovorax odorimutans TaxID=109327 RepID=UPI002108E0EF